LSNHGLKTIASQVPTTMDELKASGCLGENIIKEYGERIVRVVAIFTENNDLQHHLESSRPSKRAKVDDTAQSTAAEMKRSASIATKSVKKSATKAKRKQSIVEILDDTMMSLMMALITAPLLFLEHPSQHVSEHFLCRLNHPSKKATHATFY
jgi:putative NADH-flavin reductase